MLPSHEKRSPCDANFPYQEQTFPQGLRDPQEKQEHFFGNLTLLRSVRFHELRLHLPSSLYPELPFWIVRYVKLAGRKWFMQKCWSTPSKVEQNQSFGQTSSYCKLLNCLHPNPGIGFTPKPPMKDSDVILMTTRPNVGSWEDEAHSYQRMTHTVIIAIIICR